MVVNIDHDASKKAELLYFNRFRAVMIQSHVGSTRRHTYAAMNAYLSPYRKLGFKVGHWGFLNGQTSPEEEARLAAEITFKLDADFYVPNPEINYKYTGGEGNPQCGFCFERSLKFCNALKAAIPGLPVGVSSYARFDKADLHWAAWLNVLNARALPQAYVNEVGWEASPLLAYRGAIDVKQPWNIMRHPKTNAIISGFPKSYVHVCMAKPDPSDKVPLKMSDWIAMLVQAKQAGHTLGFGAYEVENYTVADMNELGAAIKQYGLAGI